MPQIVRLPNGQLARVPDGVSQEQILAVARRRGLDQPATSDQVAPPQVTGRSIAGQPLERPEYSEFQKGIATGVDSLQGMLYGLGALVGDTMGNEKLQQWGLEGYERNLREAAANDLKVSSLSEIDDIGDFFNFASGALGQAVPSLLSTAAGGGVGGIVGKQVAKKAITNLTKQGVKKEVAEDIVKNALKSPANRRKMMAAMKRGALTGAFVTSAGTQQGGLYADLREAGIEDAVAPAWLFGAGMGALDIVGEVALAKRLMPGQVEKELEKSLLRGLAKGTGQQAAIEGATEGAQAALGSLARILNKEDDSWTAEDWEELANNVAAGAIVGAVLGAPASLVERVQQRKPKDETRKPRQTRRAADQTSGGPTRPAAGAAPAGRQAEAGNTARPVTPPSAPVADQPTAEPALDINAQIRDLIDEKNPRRAVYLSEDNIRTHSDVLNDPRLRGFSRVPNVDGKGGVLILRQRDKIALQKRLAEGATLEEAIGELTLSGSGKRPDATAVVQQRDQDGAVTAETAVPPNEVQAAMENLLQPGRTVEVTTPEQALQRREQLIEREQAGASSERERSPQSRQDTGIVGERNPRAVRDLIRLRDGEIAAPTVVAERGSWSPDALPEWTELPGGFAARQYVIDFQGYNGLGRTPRRQIRAPNGAIVTQGLDANGQPFGEIEHGDLNEILSGQVAQAFEQYFNQPRQLTQQQPQRREQLIEREQAGASSERDMRVFRRMVTEGNYAPIKTVQSALKFARVARAEMDRRPITRFNQLSAADKDYYTKLMQLFSEENDPLPFLTETDEFNQLPEAEQERLIDEFMRAWEGEEDVEIELDIDDEDDFERADREDAEEEEDYLGKTNADAPFAFFGVGNRKHGEHRVLSEREKREGQEVVIRARPFPDAEHAEAVAERRRKEDPDAVYVVRNVGAREAEEFGLQGPGWYVAAHRVPSADYGFSRKAGGVATARQLTEIYIQSAKDRWQRLRPSQKNPRDKNAPVYGFMLDVLDSEGNPVLTSAGNPLRQGFAAQDIVQLGYAVDPELQGTDARTTIDAFREGLARIIEFVDYNGRRYRVGTEAPAKQATWTDSRGVVRPRARRDVRVRFPRNLVLREANPRRSIAEIRLGDAHVLARTLSRSTAPEITQYEGEDLASARLREITRGEDVVTMGVLPEPERPRRVFIPGEQDQETGYYITPPFYGVDHSPEVRTDEGVPVADRGANPNYPEEQIDVDTRAAPENEEAQNRRSLNERGTTELGISREGRAAPIYNTSARIVTVRMRNPRMHTAVGGFVHAIRRTLGLKEKFFITDQLDVLQRALAEQGEYGKQVEVENAVQDARHRGFVLHGVGDGQTKYIYLRPGSSIANTIKTLSHEIGHVFYLRYWDETPQDVKRAIGQAFIDFMKKNPDYRKELGNNHKQRFKEYIADQVAAWVASDRVPRSTVERWFKRLADSFKAIFDAILQRYPADVRVQNWINDTINAHSTKIDDSLDSLGAANDHIEMDVVDNMESANSPIRSLWAKVRAWKAKYPTIDKMTDFVSKSAMAMHNTLSSRLQARIRRLGYDAFNKIIDEFHKRPGDVGGFTFDAAVANRIRNFEHRYAEIMKTVKNESGFLEAMRQERSIDEMPKQFQEPARKMRELLRSLYEYQVEAGLPISEVPHYFPQVGDVVELSKPDAPETIYQAIQNAGVKMTTPDGGEKEVTRDMVQGWVTSLRDDSFSVNFDPARIGDTTSRTPHPFLQSINSRVLQPQIREVIRNILDENGQSRFYAKDMGQIMSRYIRQVVRRAEYNRRFGEDVRNIPPSEDDPRKLSREWNPHARFHELMNEAARAGASQKDQELMYDAMAAFMGNYNRIQSPEVARLTKSVAFYQNVRLLLYVTLASIPEFTNLFLHTGNFGDTWRVIRQTAADSWRKDGRTSGLLRAYGYAADMSDAMAFREIIDAHDYDSTISRLNEKWFKAIGLQRWTQFMRGLALHVSQDYMLRHAQRVADGLDTDGDSIRRLEELGVSVDDLRFWNEAGRPVFGEGTNTFEDVRYGRSAFTAEQLAAIERVTGAVTRMINDIVINPTAAQKPLWFSDQRLQLLSQFKSFTYGFLDTTLSRVWYELNRKGAPTMVRAAPLIALSLTIPVAALGLELRELITHVMWGKEPRTDGMSGPEYLAELISRTGVLGPAQLAFDATEAATFGQDLTTGFAGPTVAQVNNAFRVIGQTEDTSRAVRKVGLTAVPFFSSTPGARDWLSGQ